MLSLFRQVYLFGASWYCAPNLAPTYPLQFVTCNHHSRLMCAVGNFCLKILMPLGWKSFYIFYLCRNFLQLFSCKSLKGDMHCNPIQFNFFPFTSTCLNKILPPNARKKLFCTYHVMMLCYKPGISVSNFFVSINCKQVLTFLV